MKYLTKSYCVFKYSSYMGCTELPRNHIGITRVKQKRAAKSPYPSLTSHIHTHQSAHTRRVPCTKPQGTVRAHIDIKRCHTSPSSFTTRCVHTQTPQWKLLGRGRGREEEEEEEEEEGHDDFSAIM